jgi:hypothetical protein
MTQHLGKYGLSDFLYFLAHFYFFTHLKIKAINKLAMHHNRCGTVPREETAQKNPPNPL